MNEKLRFAGRIDLLERHLEAMALHMDTATEILNSLKGEVELEPPTFTVRPSAPAPTNKTYTPTPPMLPKPEPLSLRAKIHAGAMVMEMVQRRGAVTEEEAAAFAQSHGLSYDSTALRKAFSNLVYLKRLRVNKATGAYELVKKQERTEAQKKHLSKVQKDRFKALSPALKKAQIQRLLDAKREAHKKKDREQKAAKRQEARDARAAEAAMAEPVVNAVV